MGQGETNVNTEFGCGTEILKFALYNVTSKSNILIALSVRLSMTGVLGGEGRRSW